jgi:hypothetical protein
VVWFDLFGATDLVVSSGGRFYGFSRMHLSISPIPQNRPNKQVNGQKVTGDEAGLGETVSLISKSQGPVEIKLRRGGQEIVKKVTPRTNTDTGRSSIGVQMAAHIEVGGGGGGGGGWARAA